MIQIEKYGKFEIILCNIDKVPAAVAGEAVFQNGRLERKVPAFLNRPGEYMVRFMPSREGTWTYRITLGGRQEEGTFLCTANTGENHGPVQTEGLHFRYADGERYLPFGTTCYAWIHQTEELQEETLATLSHAPFNKIRMCVFPKSMPYNNNDPDCYPFRKRENGSWDVGNPDPVFWEKLDERIARLMELGIEADLILFHPYDRWGFAELSQEDSLAYLEYCIARLGAYRNIWWSLANEYEVLYKKSIRDWDAYGEMLAEKDMGQHLVSVHNIVDPYPKREWMSHCSIQSGDINRVIIWQQEYGIPVLIDECGYEGNLPYNWGSLSAFEMVHRFWWTVCRGGFCTHGETFHQEDEVLWWAKGGKLYGKSPERIGFLKLLLESLPGYWQTAESTVGDPNQEKDSGEADSQEAGFQKVLKNASRYGRETFIENTTPMGLRGDSWYLEYMGRFCPYQALLRLPDDAKYRIEIIDVWDMHRTEVLTGVSGDVKVELPSREGMAVLAVRM